MFRQLVLCVIAAGALSPSRADVAFPGEAWEEATPASQGVHAEKLRAAVECLKEHTGRDGVGELVIVRRGRVIHKGERCAKVHGVWSATKSFTSTVLGLLIDDGKCALDAKACRFLPELRETYPDVTLRHFATMTSGYRAKGDEPQGTYVHGPSRTPFDPDPTPLFTPPGTRYAYWDSAMNQLANVLTRIAGEPIEELFRRRIAEPVGMDPDGWDWGDFGEIGGIVVNGGSGNQSRHVRISALELARLGHLFLNRGRWKERQLISSAWIDAATSNQVPASTPPGQPECRIQGSGVYGFNWWVNGLLPGGRRKWPSAPPGTYAASGFNNNKCFVVPEWDAVIVRLGLDGNVDDSVWDAFFAKAREAFEGPARPGSEPR